MADVRVTVGRGSRIPGTEAGIQVNTFGLDRLMAGVTGAALEPLLYEALEPSFELAHEAWPVLTGASRDSMRLQTIEIEARRARVALLVGGEQLKSDPRNITPGKDYAPFIEYNGTATVPPGTIAYAIHSREQDIRAVIHEGVGFLIEELLGGSLT